MEKLPHQPITCSSPSLSVNDFHISPSSEYCTMYSVTHSLVVARPAVAIFRTIFRPPRSMVRKWK